MSRGFPRLPGIAAQSAIGSATSTGLPGDRRGLERELAVRPRLQRDHVDHGIGVERPVDVRERLRLPRHVVVLPRRRQAVAVDDEDDQGLAGVRVERVRDRRDLRGP